MDIKSMQPLNQHHVETSNESSIMVSSLPNNTVISLMAPTASGKTALAYELYDTGRFEIISVDSALIYRDMDIGTAKPSKQELVQYPHHMVDIIDPTETYSVASFINCVEILIKDIHSRGKIPLLVGGTMMYYMAMFEGLSPVPETDFSIRQQVEAWQQEAGIEVLYEYLHHNDPAMAKRLEPADTQRITRAVEVYKQTGKPLSEWQKLPKQALADNPNQYWLGLAIQPDRAWLHKRIALRLDMMWQSGFFAEVINLLTRYELTVDMPSLRCVGYRQVIDYLLAINQVTIDPNTQAVILNPSTVLSTNALKQITTADNLASTAQQKLFTDMQNKALYATRQLAKRQYTWLRNLTKRYAVHSAPVCNAPEKNDSVREFDIQNKHIAPFNSVEQAQDYILSRVC